ncbi:hypothetical protein KCP74_00395 [Salmonella enterica subsp. enterica]|nr:hypothetical protein KCP74_00395 [Salmonella enterica subsp. enterica]
MKSPGVDFDVGAKGHSPPSGVAFPDRYARRYETSVRHHGFRQRAGCSGLIDKFRVDRLFAHRIVTLAGFIILTGDVQDVRADNGAGLRQDRSVGWRYRVYHRYGDIAIAFLLRFWRSEYRKYKTQAFSSDC